MLEGLLQVGYQTFHDVSPPNVARVAHALALDEQRADFEPTYWTGGDPKNVEEVWFAGAHSNVGGGYDDAWLSNIALAWMAARAVAAKLPTADSYIRGWFQERASVTAADSYQQFLRGWGRVGIS